MVMMSPKRINGLRVWHIPCFCCVGSYDNRGRGMFKKTLMALAMTVMAGVATAAPVVVKGSIYNIDSNGDGQLDGRKISQVTFSVSAGTQVFFDSLVRESTGVDLNGDGVITGFDNYMMLLQGGNALFAQDDSGETYGDGS